jgi:uncharacterized repeat protein (TIGR03803 family)
MGKSFGGTATASVRLAQVVAGFGVAAAFALYGCGGGATPTYSLSANVTGLANSGLVLSVNGSSVSVPSGTGTIQLAATLPRETNYTVGVQTQPVGESCVVANGTGTIGSTNVTDVMVTCFYQALSVGGTISGLTGSGLVIANGADTVTVPSGATSFTMPSQVVYGHSYVITVKSHPVGLNCAVTNGTGTMQAAAVTNVGISCLQVLTILYSFGGGNDGANPYGNLIQASDGSLYGMTPSGGASGAGTVFKITTAGVETVLYSFAGGTDGGSPAGSLVEANDGNLYGTTNGVGANGVGTVFRITPNGVETVLHSFAGANDGAHPKGSLIQGSDGNLYGMTAAGGAGGGGVVFRITLAGVVTVLHSFTGEPADGYAPSGSLIQAADGDFYGTTSGPAYGTVFTITAAGVEKVLYAFAGGSDGLVPFGSLIQLSDGNLYGTTSGGLAIVGSNANQFGTVFKITSAGIETPIYSFSGGLDGSSPSGSLIQAADGSLYGTTPGGGSAGLGTVFKLTLSGTQTVLYSFASVPDGSRPTTGLIRASDGKLYGMTNDGGANGYGTVFRIN